MKKALLQGVKRGNTLTLVTQELAGDPLSIVQYANTELYTYTARPLEGSVVVVGRRLVCTFSGGIDGEKLGRDASVAWCSDNPVETETYRSTLLPLLGRSHPYLK